MSPPRRGREASSSPSSASDPPASSDPAPTSCSTPSPDRVGRLPKGCLGERAICIDKAQRLVRLVEKGEVVLTLDARFGFVGAETREGTFRIQRKSRDHTSSLYRTWMPFALFFSGGQAVHYSPVLRPDGYNGASHGCVNLRDFDRARWLFDRVPDRHAGPRLPVVALPARHESRGPRQRAKDHAGLSFMPMLRWAGTSLRCQRLVAAAASASRIACGRLTPANSAGTPDATAAAAASASRIACGRLTPANSAGTPDDTAAPPHQPAASPAADSHQRTPPAHPTTPPPHQPAASPAADSHQRTPPEHPTSPPPQPPHQPAASPAADSHQRTPPEHPTSPPPQPPHQPAASPAADSHQRTPPAQPTSRRSSIAVSRVWAYWIAPMTPSTSTAATRAMTA